VERPTKGHAYWNIESLNQKRGHDVLAPAPLVGVEQGSVTRKSINTRRPRPAWGLLI
jgi:hypothetical protein